MAKCNPIQMQTYTVHIYTRGKEADGCLRGIIETEGADHPVAFSGFYELWQAVEHLRRHQCDGLNHSVNEPEGQ